jgi:sulfate adenylyltransferase
MENKFELSEELLQDCVNIGIGLFEPLSGFMGQKDYRSVVDHMKLASGDVWTIPITLDIDQKTFGSLANGDTLILTYNHKRVATLLISECFTIDLQNDLMAIYGTYEDEHPGVKKEKIRSPHRIGGRITITDRKILKGSLDPRVTKSYFKKMGWKTIAGFQTRNPIHKAHEYLQRVALELCDALFINPLVGWKKEGDFSEQAVDRGYASMLKEYYSGLNIYYDTLKTPMRYAGPREAIFHALIRRNLGCTHFVIGRDHAGVGNYYGKYEAHELAKNILAKHDLGIELLLLSEPFYCHRCEQIVSDSTCHHSEKYIEKISGTKIRNMLEHNKRPSELYMRPEVADSIIELKDKKFLRI